MLPFDSIAFQGWKNSLNRFEFHLLYKKYFFITSGSHTLCEWPPNGYQTEGTLPSLQSLWGKCHATALNSHFQSSSCKSLMADFHVCQGTRGKNLNKRQHLSGFRVEKLLAPTKYVVVCVRKSGGFTCF